MTVHYRTQGFILGKEDRGEADRVFTVFTKDFGRLKLRAVSERKITSKLRGGLELFYLSDIEFIQGKYQKTLTNASPLKTYRHMRQDLLRLVLVWRIAEFFNKVVRDQEVDEKIWNILHETFDMMNNEDLNSQALKLIPSQFRWNLLSVSGYKPL